MTIDLGNVNNGIPMGSYVSGGSGGSGGSTPSNMVTTDTEQEITGSKLFSNGLKVEGYAGISDNNNKPFIQVVESPADQKLVWGLGSNDTGGNFNNIIIKRGSDGNYINIDSGNLIANLPIGSSTQEGIVQVDGTTIVSNDGVISAIGGGSSAPENMVTTDTEQTISRVKTFSAGIKGNGYIKSIGLTDLIYTDVNKNPHVGNTSRTLTVHTNPIGHGRILIDDGSATYEDLHTGNIANFIDGTSITFTNNKLSATSAGGAAPENMVTTDTEQTITGKKTFTDKIQVGTLSRNLISTYNDILQIGARNYVAPEIAVNADIIKDRDGNEYLKYSYNAFKQIKLTQEAYDALTTKDENTMYIIVG